MAGKILLYTVLGLLGLLALLVVLICLADFTLRVRYWDGAFTVSAGVWPVTIPVFPGKEEPEKKTPPPGHRRRTKAAQKAKKEIEAEPGDLKQDIAALKDLFTAFFPPAVGLVKGLKVRRLTLHIRVGGRDAADTAIRYGQVNALLHGSIGAASNLVSLKAKHLGVSYDFLSRETKTYLEADLRLRGARILWGVLSGFARMVGQMLKNMLPEIKRPAK